MTAAVNLFLSVLAAWFGVVVAVGSLVYLCAIVCRFVSREWRLRRLWTDEPEALDVSRPYDWKDAA